MANHEQDLLWVYNPTTAPFEVKFGGHPHRLESGEKKLFPRFIAEHFAKHLADAILMRKEIDDQKKTGKLIPLVNSPKYRPRIIEIILPEVYSYYQAPRKDDNAAINAMVDQVNRGIDPSTAPNTEIKDEEALDFGLIPNKAVGVLQEPTALPSAEDMADEGNDGTLLEDAKDDLPKDDLAVPTVPTVDPSKPKRSRTELLKEAIDLGIEVPPKASAAEIEALIKKNFA